MENDPFPRWGERNKSPASEKERKTLEEEKRSGEKSEILAATN